MSATVTGTSVLPACAPVGRKMRAYFAPVTRVVSASSLPAVWDPALMGAISLDAMPAPWVDLGRISGFLRRSGTTVEAVRAGSPPSARWQARTGVAAEVEFAFERWGKLQLALSCGVQQMNLLVPATGAAAAASGAVAGTAVALISGSGVPAQTATALQVGAAAAAEFVAGQMIAVDVDYAGQTGFVGSGASGAYVVASSVVNGDVNYIRRVTLNVGVVASISDGALTLADPLLAGVPTPGMKVSPLLGFLDREGGGFFQEWSAVFAIEGEEGDRVFFFYPRLEASGGPAEVNDALDGKAGALQRIRLQATFRALAAKDTTDGQMVLCYRSYLPAAMREV